MAEEDIRIGMDETYPDGSLGDGYGVEMGPLINVWQR